MTQKDFKPDINFLYEMGNIRLIDRMWRRFHSTDFANVAEHHFRVFWIAMVIAKNEDDGTLDTGKIAKMCIMHDITESRTGEVDYISRQYVDRKEEMAINDMLDDTSVQEEYLALWHEYEARESLESKIVKDADNLDVDFELAEQENNGNTLKDEWKTGRQKVADSKLYTETARQIHEQLKAVGPHDWHSNSQRNRHNGGDWKNNKLAKK
jgi:putative hydrolases of HD superfamily